MFPSLRQLSSPGSRCQLGDSQGLNRIFTIGCADKDGNRVGNLAEWADGNVRKRWLLPITIFFAQWKRMLPCSCVLDVSKGTGQIQIIRPAPQALPAAKLRCGLAGR